MLLDDYFWMEWMMNWGKTLSWCDCFDEKTSLCPQIRILTRDDGLKNKTKQNSSLKLLSISDHRSLCVIQTSVFMDRLPLRETQDLDCGWQMVGRCRENIFLARFLCETQLELFPDAKVWNKYQSSYRHNDFCVKVMVPALTFEQKLLQAISPMFKQEKNDHVTLVFKLTVLGNVHGRRFHISVHVQKTLLQSWRSFLLSFLCRSFHFFSSRFSVF